MIKEIVFDFDGTIGLTLDLSVEILNCLVSELGYRQINNKDIKVFRTQGWRKALKGVNFPLWKVPKVGIKVQTELHKQIEEVKIAEGLKDVLKKMAKKDLVLGILTSNTKENVEKFCKKNGLDMFKYVYSEKSLFGKEKGIKKLLKERKLKKDEIIYIGDEVRDWEACQKVGVKMIGVSWGFNDKKLLKQSGLKEVIDRPEEIIGFL